MTAFVASILGSLAGGGGAAAGAAGAAGAVGGASTIAGILSGGATALSVLMGIGASREEATSLELAANDAKSEQVDEELLGLQRRNALKKDLIQALGERDVAYAASGVDLSFGTPAEARASAQEDYNRAVSVDIGTERSRIARLQERADLLRARAKSVRRGGLLQGLLQGLSGGADILYRG